jgi:hypothetical protein
MKSKCNVNVYLVIAGLALVLVSGGCATTAPKAERYVAPPSGSMFTYSQVNTGAFGSGTAQATSKIAERMWEGQRVTAIVSSSGVLLQNADGKWSVILGPDDKQIISYDPPAGYDYPLEVAKTWTKSYRMTIHPRNQTIPFDMTYKIESYEDVTVPAGTFKVFKVSVSNTIGTEMVQWFSPELGSFVKQIQKRPASSPLGPGTRDEELISYTIAK